MTHILEIFPQPSSHPRNPLESFRDVVTLNTSSRMSGCFEAPKSPIGFRKVSELSEKVTSILLEVYKNSISFHERFDPITLFSQINLTTFKMSENTEKNRAHFK